MRPDPLSMEAFKEQMAKVPPPGNAAPLERARWSLEAFGQALHYCRDATDHELWAIGRTRYFKSPENLDEALGDAHRTVTITERDYKRLQVYERAYKVAVHAADMALGALSNLYLDHIRTLETIRDAASLPKRPGAVSPPARETRTTDA